MLHARMRDGSTPLLICSDHCCGCIDCESLRLLARAGAALDARRKPDGAQPVHLVARSGCEGCLSFLLSRASYLVDARDKSLRQPLHYAAASAAPGALSLIPTSFWHRSGPGPTAPHHHAGAAACVAALLRAGADVEASCSAGAYCERPLHVACRNGHEPSATLLLHARADADARAAGRRTPLHLAAEGLHPRLVSCTTTHLSLTRSLSLPPPSRLCGAGARAHRGRRQPSRRRQPRAQCVRRCCCIRSGVGVTARGCWTRVT